TLSARVSMVSATLSSSDLTLEKLLSDSSATNRIFSFLDLRSRMTIRECSKLMKKSVEGTDLSVDDVTLRFSNKEFLNVIVDDSIKLQSNYNDMDSLRSKLHSMKKSFRYLNMGTLRIACRSHLIDTEILEKITANFKFRSIDLIFNGIFQDE
ncbi:hypothetical protein PFISCL1PPCAC_25092, partial [Pristionchus fissidentatus]